MTERKEVTLSDLVGEHMLDAVDTYIEKVNPYGGDYTEDAEVIRFRLDGVLYVAIEDPSDGYRSSMETLVVSDDKPVNVFPPVRVLGKMKDDEAWQTNDVLQLIDLVTGKIVMEVGTDNTDDYYPSFVSAFSPENMATNSAQTSAEPR